MNVTRGISRMLLLALVCAGCAASRQAAGEGGSAGPVTVEVVNQHRRDVAVYWVVSGTRVRLGTAVAGGRNRFVVRNTRPAALSSVQLTAAVIGSGEEYTTERIAVSPGQIIDLHLQDLLVSSEFSVRDAPAARERRP